MKDTKALFDTVDHGAFLFRFSKVLKAYSK